MTEQELKKLSRKELLEMLIMQSEELESTKKKLANAKSKLLEKEISIDNAGSIAEAALQVNGVFEAAQAACEQYIDNIKNLSKRQETICDQKMKECEQQTQKMLKDAQIECDMMRAKAKVDAESYWNEVRSRLENFYKEYNELQKILPIKDQ
ncbi:hypothetical protein [Floccifex sp.]|uniref:hypothetical protein n=1 Tax=Floccifex sp. TaxID=2815810 RepID=UPI003F0B3BC8